MKVPLLDLKAQYLTIKEEIKAAIDEVLESQIFILGPKVEELEKSVAAYSQTKYGIGVSSGTDALLISLMAIDIQPDVFQPSDLPFVEDAETFLAGGVGSFGGGTESFEFLIPVCFAENLDDERGGGLERDMMSESISVGCQVEKWT